MNYGGMAQSSDNNSIIVDRLVLKGKGILDLCLEQGKNLCMKGFIDYQVEKGGAYAPVVERMVNYIDTQLEQAGTTDRRELLLDLHTYADAQLRIITSLPESSPGAD